MEKEKNSYKGMLNKITTLVFDYDGVLASNTVILTEDGEPLRGANVKDGYALQLAAKKGYRIAIITGGRSKSLKNRFQKLGVADVFLNAVNKLEVYEAYVKKHGLNEEHILFMGDDIPDYPLMKRAGVATCPADASEEIKSASDFISHFKGGQGCVREIIEQVMKVQGHWMTQDAFHW